MIDLRGVWLPQIIGYAELISEERILRSAWIDGDRSATSVTDFDELIEQIFGLDSEAQVELAKSELSDDPEITSLLAGFIAELQRVDRFVVDTGISNRPEHILASTEWMAFRDFAQRLATYAAYRGYPNDFADTEPTMQSNT